MKRIFCIVSFSAVLFSCEKPVIVPNTEGTKASSCNACDVKGGANPNAPSSGVDINNPNDTEGGITDPNKDKDEAKRKGSN